MSADTERGRGASPAMRDERQARGTLSALAKQNAPARAQDGAPEKALNATQDKARDPDAWIVRIRKLRDEGRDAEALAELREFDANVPDARQRMPAELRQFLERGTTK
jgi:hypothetical protein